MRHADYAAIDAVNWSSLKSMRVSPLQYRYDRSHPRESTPAMRLGIAIHALTLEPALFEREFAVWPGQRRGKAWDEFAAAHAARHVLTAAEHEQANGAAQAVLDHPLSRPYVVVGDLRIEQAITWADAETGLRCKARVDIAGSRVVELKSTADLLPHRFGATAARLGYASQLAFYVDGLRANGVELPDEAVIIAVQSEPPHDVATYLVPDDVVDHGRGIYRALLGRLRECLEADEWPGICAEHELTLSLPAWAYDEAENDPPLTIGGVAIAI